MATVKKCTTSKMGIRCAGTTSLKSEREERKRIETQVKKEIAAAKTEAEEKVQSNIGALTVAKQKIFKAKAQVKTEAQPFEAINTFKRIRKYILNLRNIKRKIALLSVLAIFTAITFVLSVTNDPSVAESDRQMAQEQALKPIALMRSDVDMNQKQNAVESVNLISPAKQNINKKAYVEQVRRMGALLENMKVAPYIVNGQEKGLYITGLDDLNMAGNFGFENGDVIQAINGQMLTDKQKAFQVLKKGRSQSSLNFQLLRNKQKMDLSFEIK